MIIKPVTNAHIRRDESTPQAREIWQNIERAAKRFPSGASSNTVPARPVAPPTPAAPANASNTAAGR